MGNRIEYSEENGYLIRTFHGIYYIDDIVQSWKYLINTKLKEKSYLGVLNDFNNAQLNMELEDLDKVLDLFKNNIQIFKNLKLAVIMSTPDNIIFPIFASSKSPFNIAAFSTIEAAKNWILK